MKQWNEEGEGVVRRGEGRREVCRNREWEREWLWGVGEGVDVFRERGREGVWAGRGGGKVCGQREREEYGQGEREWMLGVGEGVDVRSRRGKWESEGMCAGREGGKVSGQGKREGRCVGRERGRSVDRGVVRVGTGGEGGLCGYWEKDGMREVINSHPMNNTLLCVGGGDGGPEEGSD
ncbi:hypothetical protein Pcinc_039599 [Petrolisthes cinctipes]|uniref:Uncharacterized protein n=1 Tax=Petrolisthes cinctipes TaxID=88211 RepID=A0AAE1BND0_PETCI|nr:hypothetical protein Pcinc_039599 [Petrolisthes cinctipes]